MRRVFVDTNVFVYAVGTDHPYREPCRRLVRLIASGDVLGETSVEVVQEFVHVRRRRAGRHDALRRGREIVGWCPVVHLIDQDSILRALELLDAHEELTVRDAVHAATALRNGIDAIVTADRHFDVLGEVERIEPDAAAASRLTR